MENAIPFGLFHGRRVGETVQVLDLEGRTIIKSTIRPFDWGRGSELCDRRALASTLLYHAGIGDQGPAADAYATAVLLNLPYHEWTITTDQIFDWYRDYITRGGFDGQSRPSNKGNFGQAGR